MAKTVAGKISGVLNRKSFFFNFECVLHEIEGT